MSVKIMEWSQSANGTGCLFADNEHQTIFDFVNQTGSAVESGNQAKVVDLLEDTTDYTVQHFSSEERMMERKGYDAQKLKNHKASHAKFIGSLRELQAAKRDVTLDDLKGAAAWFIAHINNEDKDYEGAING